MFISKKRFQEEIAKAQRETEEKICQQQRMWDFERRTSEEIDRIRCDFGKHNFDVDARLDRLEKAVFEKKQTPCNGGETCGKSELK